MNSSKRFWIFLALFWLYDQIIGLQADQCVSLAKIEIDRLETDLQPHQYNMLQKCAGKIFAQEYMGKLSRRFELKTNDKLCDNADRSTIQITKPCNTDNCSIYSIEVNKTLFCIGKYGLLTSYNKFQDEFTGNQGKGAFMDDYRTGWHEKGLSVKRKHENLEWIEKNQLTATTKMDKMDLEKFIKIKYTKDWSGMCNEEVDQIELEWKVLWQFASLYGIGKSYGRKPIYSDVLWYDSKHKTESDEELLQLFPVYASQRKFMSLESNKHQIYHLQDFQQSTELYNLKQKYVMVKGIYLQSYKFFEGRRREIRQIFQFGPSICSKVEAYGKKLFGSDKSHKFCVHIRRGDFIPLGHESKKEFTEKGIIYGYKQLTKVIDFQLIFMEKINCNKIEENQFLGIGILFQKESINFKLMQKIGKISVVLMGLDRKFINDLAIDRELIPKVYYPEPKSRGEDMAFASTVCNSLLITAPASTFTWWIAYLMPDNSTIFYKSTNGGVIKTKLIS